MRISKIKKMTIMGYDISLEKDGKTVKLHKPLKLIGSVYAVDGSDEASYAITFNYSEFYTKAFDDPNGIGCLNGLCYSDGIAKIATAISRLSDENLPSTIEEFRQEEAEYAAQLQDTNEDSTFSEHLKSKIKEIRNRIAKADPCSDRVEPSYCDATPGNAKQALRNLIKMARPKPRQIPYGLSVNKNLKV